MQYKTHNDIDIDPNGTCLQGYIETTYNTLVKKLGESATKWTDNYKTDAEWFVKFEDGTIATIYNWKNGKNYLGVSGKAKEDIQEWNVGGRSHRAVELLDNALKANNYPTKDMKDYHAEISITFSEVGEAETKEEAIQLIKNNFYDQYGLHLTDDEIKIELYNQE